MNNDWYRYGNEQWAISNDWYYVGAYRCAGFTQVPQECVFLFFMTSATVCPIKTAAYRLYPLSQIWIFRILVVGTDVRLLYGEFQKWKIIRENGALTKHAWTKQYISNIADASAELKNEGYLLGDSSQQ